MSISEAQILTLRDKASRDGDMARLIVCNHALGIDVVVHGPIDGPDAADIVRVMGMSRSQARAEVRRIVAEPAVTR